MLVPVQNHWEQTHVDLINTTGFGGSSGELVLTIKHIHQWFAVNNPQYRWVRPTSYWNSVISSLVQRKIQKVYDHCTN